MGGTAGPRTEGRRARTVGRAGLVGLVTAAAAAAGLALPGAAAAAEDGAAGPTVYIASDSTAQTYDPYWAPQMGWGQVLDQFFSEEVTIANHAIGGRSSRSFVEEGRLDAILDEIQPGDYLFVQFGHNDGTISRPERYTPPADYKEYLRNDYIAGARERGAIPVVVTPVQRRDFDPATGQFNVSFPEYVEKAEEVAAEENVPLLDLSAASRAYLNEIGPEEAKSLFLHVPPGVYPNRPNGTIDETHFQEYGAVQIARLIATGVAGLDVPLADEVENTGPPSHRPGRPGVPAAADVSHTGARLTWDAVPGAELYRVQTRPKDDPDAEFTLATTSPIPLADLGGLAEATRYEVRVIAVNGKGQSPPSHKLRLTTLAADQRYDFGPAGSPVAEGFTGVTTETLYTPELGHGFTDTTNVISRDRGTGDAVGRDFVAYFDGRYEFKADVPNGTYAVTAYVGDALGFSRSGFVLEGGDRGQVIPGSGAVTGQTFTGVPVTDGQLNVTIYGQTGHLNGLVLTRVG